MDIHFHIPIWVLWTLGGIGCAVIGAVIAVIVANMAFARAVGRSLGW